MGLIQRGDGVGIPKQNRIISGTTIDIIDDDGYKIGYVQEISWSGNRRVEVARHLDSEDAGKVIEQTPGPENYTMNISGFSLYDRGGSNRGALINRLSKGMAGAASVNGQKASFNLVERSKHPATGEVTVRRFYDVWLTQYGETRNINTVQVVDRATAQFSTME